MTAPASLQPDGPAAESPERSQYHVRAGDAVLRRLPVVLSVIAIAVGDADRLRQYIFDRSLWNDEVVVGLNILTRGYGGLLHQLSGTQAAPPGWLWLEKLISQVFGNSEYALRLPELVAGLALPVVVALLGHRLLGRLGWIPVILVALSPYLVYYASELKPYSLDATLSLVAILFSVYALDHGLRARWLAGWSAVTATVAFLSWPGLLAVACGGAVLGLRALARAVGERRVAVAGAVALAQVPWLAILGWQYFAVIRATRHDRALEDYWAGGYPPSIHAVASWLHHTIPGLIAVPLAWRSPWLVCALVVAGAASMLITQGWPAGPIVLLPPVTVLAAVLRLYPLEGRAALSLVPISLLLAAASTRAPLLLRRPGRAGRHLTRSKVLTGAAATAAAALVATVAFVARPGMGEAIDRFGRPATVTESRPALQLWKHRFAPGQGILVDAWTMSVYEYYAARLGLPAARLATVGPGRACNELVPVRRVAPSGVLWMLFTLPPSPWTGPFISQYLDVIRPSARVREEIHPSQGIWIVLLQLRAGTGLSPAPAGRCLYLGPPVTGYDR